MNAVFTMLSNGTMLAEIDPSAPPSKPNESNADDSGTALMSWMEAYRKSDDQDAFRRIFDHYRNRLWQKLHLYRFYGYEPEDLFQDVNRDIARWLKNETPHNLIGLVYRIADRKIVDFLRSKTPLQQRKLLVSMEDVEHYLTSQEPNQLEWSQSYDLQRFLFSKFINAKQREVLALFYLLGHTLAEIEDLTETPLNTVKSRLREGLRKLRSYLSRQELP